ncbi:MAG TPA: hypothetical protein VLB50_09570, partial [Ignavibacteriaceae bacterium]|nr:hypothetical protein [Ignavibacteriaceae bacterium]
FFILNILLVLNYTTFHGHHFQPKILALTHIATLGWITMIIFGALFQLIPVVLQVKLFSELLAKIQFWIFTFGVFTLVYSFWFFLIDLPLTIGASLINLAILLFLINIIVTLTQVKEWNITGTYLSAALFYLLITAIVGLMMALNLWHPYFSKSHLVYLGYHVNIAVIGWVSMVIMGVTFKLISMFTLSHNFSIISGKWAFGFINAGLIGLIILLHLPESNIFYLISAILIVVGIFFFLYQVYIIFKNRLRKKLDIALKFTFSAYIVLGITTLLGFSFLFVDYPASTNISLAYGYLIFFGFISMLIIGQMYKILPFLTWYHKYSRKAGIEKVPMLREMYNERLAKIEYYSMLAGLIGTVISIVLNINFLLLIAFIIMLISVSLFIINIIKILTK